MLKTEVTAEKVESYKPGFYLHNKRGEMIVLTHAHYIYTIYGKEVDPEDIAPETEHWQGWEYWYVTFDGQVQKSNSLLWLMKDEVLTPITDEATIKVMKASVVKSLSSEIGKRQNELQAMTAAFAMCTLS